MFIPFYDNTTVKFIRTPWATYLLVATIIAVTAVLWKLGDEELIVALALVPNDIHSAFSWVAEGAYHDADSAAITQSIARLFTHIFIHADVMQTFGNLIFLWVFGDNIEDVLGRRRFLLLFFASGVAGAIAHTYFSAHPDLPVIGSTAAVAGVFSAYMVFYPRKWVSGLLFKGIPIALPAVVWFILWFCILLVGAWLGEGPNVFLGVITGSLVGLLLAPILRREPVPIFPLFDRGWSALTAQGRLNGFVVDLDRAFSWPRALARLNRIPLYGMRPNEIVQSLGRHLDGAGTPKGAAFGASFRPATYLAHVAVLMAAFVVLVEYAGVDAEFALSGLALCYALVWIRGQGRIPGRTMTGWGLDGLTARPFTRPARGWPAWIAALLFVGAIVSFSLLLVREYVDLAWIYSGAGFLPLLLDQKELLLLLGGAFLISAAALHRRAQRIGAIRADALVALDRRRPIPFLRSFSDDDTSFTERHSVEPMFSGLVSRVLGRVTAGPRLEETAANLLAWFGPVVAIGRPGEALPELGSAKIYVSDADWQNKVSEWLDASGAIVLMAGTSEGVTWELTEIVRRGYLSRLILVFPPLLNMHASKGFQDRLARWNVLRKALPILPPPLTPEGNEIDTIAAIHFRPDGRPVFFISENHGIATYERALTLAAYGIFYHRWDDGSALEGVAPSHVAAHAPGA